MTPSFIKFWFVHSDWIAFPPHAKHFAMGMMGSKWFDWGNLSINNRKSATTQASQTKTVSDYSLDAEPDDYEMSSVVGVGDSEFFDTLQNLAEYDEEEDGSDLDHAHHHIDPSKKEVDESLEASLIATSNSHSSATVSAHRKLVRFHRIEIREYGVTLGDHPGTRTGPPVTIEWQHQAELVVDVDQYERIFSGVGSSAKFRRRKGEELRMPPDVREHILLASHGGEQGMQQEAELMLQQQQEQEGRVVRSCRASAILVLRRLGARCLLGFICWNERLEEAWQSTVRKFKRWRRRRKGERPEPAELWIETCIPTEIIFF